MGFNLAAAQPKKKGGKINKNIDGTAAVVAQLVTIDFLS